MSVLAGARSLRELKRNIPRYEGLRLSHEYHNRGAHQRNNAQARGQSVGNAPAAQRGEKNNIRCSYCSDFEHTSMECPKPKKPNKVYFGCQQPGHMIQNCPKKKVAIIGNLNETPAEEPAAMEWANEVEEDDTLNEQQQVRVCWPKFVGNSSYDQIANCLIATGSEINCIRSHTIKFYILPDRILPVDAILGREFMRIFNIGLQFIHQRSSTMHKLFNLHQILKIIVLKIINCSPKLNSFIKQLMPDWLITSKRDCGFNLNTVPRDLVID